MKVRIFIVDDERMAIKYLKYLLESTDLEYEVAGEATNSIKALPEIIRLKPDIVFVDINMPVMDGLELSEQVLKRITTKIFLLTSYRDFDYVKKGIQIGIADYILKNELNEETLGKLLEKTAGEILVEKKKQHLILEHNVREFLLSNSMDIEDHVYEHRPMQRYALIAVVRRTGICMKHRTPGNAPKADSYELQTLAYPEGIVCSAFTELSSGELCGVFFIQGEVTDGQVLLKQAGEQIAEHLSQCGFDGVCLVSDTKYHFLELQNTYRELKGLSDYLYAFTGRQVLQACEIREQRREKVMADAWMEALNDKVEKQQSNEAWEILQDFFEHCRRNLNVWEYTECLQSVYRYLKAYVQRCHLRSAILDIPEWYPDTDSVETALSECLGLIFEEARQDEQSGCSLYVQQAIEYIRRNYSRNISVPDIAQAVKISEGHLRRLFKQELNMKVVDYLTEYRLECAKLLMKNGENSLSDIWERTGFTSAQYFSYVFKRKEGILPKDYAKKIRNG